MPPIIPARFRSPLNTPSIPAPTVSEYSPHHGGQYDYLTLQDEGAAPTPAALLNRNPEPQYYVTLTITLPYEVYTTTVLLGDNFPTPPPPTIPVQQSASQPTLTPATAQNPSSTGGNVAGIVIGVLGSLAVLAGIYYVFLLRARQLRRFSSGTSTTRTESTRKRKHKKKRKRKKKKKSKTTVTWFTSVRFRWMKSKPGKRSRRSSTSTASKS